MDIAAQEDHIPDIAKCIAGIVRSNQQNVDRLLALCDLLDVAGLGVAFRKPHDAIVRVGRSGLNDLKINGDSCGGSPSDWEDLLSRVPADRVLVSLSGLLVWHPRATGPSEKGQGAELTPREREVMIWIGRGKTAPEVAMIVGCALRTVEKHISNSYKKMRVHDRSEWILSPHLLDESILQSE